MIQQSYMTSPISIDEREAHFFYEGDSVICDTTIPTVWRKCQRQGWTVKAETYFEGNIVGMVLTAPKNALRIANAVQKKREMTEEQRAAAADRLRKAREQKVGAE